MKTFRFPPLRRSLAHALLAGAMASSLLTMADPAQAVPDESFKAAFDRFRQAAGGDVSAVDSASDAFNALLKAEPGNPVLMAYVGASTSMRARTTAMQWKKLAFAEDGLAQIDKALAVAANTPELPSHRGTPGLLELKFVSASAMLAMPGFMNRGARGARLLGEVIESPVFASAPVGFRGQVLLRAGELAIEKKQAPDARHFLGEVVSLNAPQADAARTKLREVAP